jgi:hypothetical protein
LTLIARLRGTISALPGIAIARIVSDGMNGLSHTIDRPNVSLRLLLTHSILLFLTEILELI